MNKRIIITLLFSALFFTSINSALIYASFSKAPDVNLKSVVASPNTIWVPDDYTRIKWAIGNASDGDTIRVRAGTYNESVTIYDKKNLMLIGESRENTIIDSKGDYVVFLHEADNVTVSGFTIQNGEHGIYLWDSNNNIITGNVASNNSYGIYLYYSGSNVISGNEASSNGYGIYLSHSSNNIITGNVASNNERGIYLSHSSDNTLTGNVVSNNDDGIYLDDSGYNALTDNNASSNGHGIYLHHSSNNVLSGNTASNNSHGIYVGDSGNNAISGNTASNNDYGIYLYYSGNNVLSGNDASNNEYGIYLWGSSNNIITGSVASNNERGIHLYYSGNNAISGNTASNNSHGIFLLVSSNNIIFHNDFISNVKPLNNIASVNSWDNGVEGNYWSDYDGADANWDGIGDAPYPIDENSQDSYPLMAMLLQFNVMTENQSYKINVVCNSTISNFQGRYDVYNRINAVSFKVNGAEGKGFCRICIPHALIEPSYTVTVDYDPPLYSKIVYTNGTHTWLYFTYEHSEREVIVMHSSSPGLAFLSQWAMLGLTVTVVILLSISIYYHRLFREQRKVIQAYERELGSFPVTHSERARARFIKDVVEREEKIEKFKEKYSIKIQPADTLEDLMEKLGVQKQKEKVKH